MKVLEVVESYGGGVKTQVDQINKYLGKSIDLLTVVSSVRSTRKVPAGYKVLDSLSSPQKIINFIFAVMKIKKIIVTEQVNLVHFHSTIAGIVALFLRVFCGVRVPFVYTPHAYYSEGLQSGVKRNCCMFVEKTIVKSVNIVIHVSPEEADYAITNKIVPLEKVKIIMNGVRDPHFKRTWPDKDTIKVVNVARASDQKNPQLFVKVAKHIIQSFPTKNFEFNFVGDGVLLEESKELTEKYGLAKQIHFVGFSSNVAEYYRNSDIYLSTSRYEGLPYSVVEAMSFELPVILSNVVGHKDLIKGNGFLFDVANGVDDFFKESLTKLLTNSGYETAAYASYGYFREKFEVTGIMNEIGNVYKLLDKKKLKKSKRLFFM